MESLEFLKYILLFVGIVTLVLEKTLRTKKVEDAESKKYSKVGWFVLIYLPIVCLVTGLILAITDDQKAKKEKQVFLRRQLGDSILLSKRWEFDTIRLKQILDSSEKIIIKSNENLAKANSNFKVSEKLLTTQAQQMEISRENLKKTEKLIYILPDTLGFRFVVQFDLGNQMKALNSKLESIVPSYANKAYKINNNYYFNTENEFDLKTIKCDDSNLTFIKSFCKDLLTLNIDFSSNKRSMCMLFAISGLDKLLDSLTSKDAYLIFDKLQDGLLDNFSFIYFKTEKKIIVKLPNDYFIPIVGIAPFKDRGLYELENSIMSVIVSKGKRNADNIKIRSITLRLKPNDLLFFSNFEKADMKKIPINYSEVKNEMLFFQKKVHLFSNRINARMHRHYENTN